MTKTASPARDALATHRAHIDALTANSRSLEKKIEAFQETVAAQSPVAERLAGTRAKRRELLAQVAIGEQPHSVLDRADADLSDAEAAAAVAARVIEIAEAGAERFRRESEVLARQIATAMPHTAPLVHAGALELAHSRLDDYRAANARLSETHAALMGAVLVADDFADTRATPPRHYASGNAGQFVFDALLPEIGLDRTAWTFNSTAQVAAAKAAALRELGA